MQELFEIPVQV